MPRDLRDLVGDIRGALDTYPKEGLVEILSYIFKEYVVQGSAPLAVPAPSSPRELESLDFAALITYLQLHLDVPELALFEVQGNQVSVRVGGRLVALQAPQARPEPPPPVAVAAPVPAPAPAPAQAAPAPTAAPRPAAAPVSTPATVNHSANPIAPTGPAPAGGQSQQPAQQPAQQSNQPKTEEGESTRFSYLEID